MKKILLFLCCLSSITFFAQNTYVPDDNFEQALIDLGYDTVLDNYVSTANINTITKLVIPSKNISDLTGIEGFTSLKELFVNNNVLTSINISSNPALTRLDAYENKLTAIDVSNNTNLEVLFLYKNQLTSIDISKNKKIYSFKVNNNQLSSLDVSQNTGLQYFYAAGNQLTSLDLSKNTALIAIYLENNKLTWLNAKNGANNLITNFSTTQNPDLKCIQVDNTTASRPWGWAKDYTASYNVDCTPKTYVPDDNFEQALIDLGYDDVLDDYVKTENINSINYLDVSNKGIVDLTGIQDFITLTELRAYKNQLTSIEVSTITNLKKLYVYNNQLTSIEVSTITNLEKLYVYNNQLTSLNLSNNHLLTELVVSYNQITSLDLSANIAITTLNFEFNQLTNIDLKNNVNLLVLAGARNKLSSIDLSNNKDLIHIDLENNQLTSLDLSNNRALISLLAKNNKLSSVNLSTASALKNLYISGNQLTNLDIRNSTLLESFYGDSNRLVELDLSMAAVLKNCIVNDNQLTNLNLKSGANTAITSFNIIRNPNLTCVQVDDAAYSTTNWTNKDAATTYSENCGGVKNTFTTNASGNWNEAANWSLGHVPTQDEVVEIPNTSTIIVPQNTFYEVKKITNQGVLHLYGKLTVTDEFINTGRLMYNAVGSLLASKTSGVGAFVFTKNSYKGNALDPTKWYLFSLPSSGIIAQEVIANSTLATGTGTNKGLATYNNSYTGSTGWSYFNSLSQDLLSQGQGVAVKMMASSSMYLRKIQENVDAALLLSNYTIGTNKGTKNGWNLMGNPYLASIPVNSATNKADNFLAINGAKLDPAYAALYFWNPDTNSYDVVNNTTSEKYITPMEGFFVKTSTDVSNVDYKSVSLVHLPNNYAGRKLDSLTEIALRLELKEKKQKTIIKYLDDATDGLDIGYDAGVFNADKTEVSIYTNLVAEGNGTHFAIQCLPKDKIENSIIPIGIEAIVGEELTIKVEANQLPIGVKVLLEDKKTNTFTDLTDETAAYTITLKEKENNKNRFYLHTRAESLSNDEVFQTDVTILKTEENLIQLKGLKNEGEVYIYNMQGKLVQQSKVNQHKNKVNIPTLAKGVYIVNLKTNDKQITQKIIL
ncbi:leucine-rich repeat domain-containing protein [Tenacibaculum sp. TC6]|uniref:leucine-rich repeat domain-containing protein n=1 Tax=Tenacibaculum sp. TC6 TaxID=3423223 RepID=UPI003D3677B6